MSRIDKAGVLVDRIKEGVKNLFDSENYKAYLNTMNKFYQYSVNNTILIMMQRPDASAVASYTSWKNNFGRHVKEGAKGIQIIQPCPYIVKDKVEIEDINGNKKYEEVEKLVQGYKVGYVFDLEDTEGTPLPEIVTLLQEDFQNYELMKKCLEDISPVPVTYEKINSSANGYYDLTNKRIVVDSSLSESQTIKTLIHEIAHSILHDKDNGIDKETNRREREVEAESVAYSVASYYGLDTSDYSFGYIASWSDGKELTELREHLEAIKTAAGSIIDSVDEKILEYHLSNNVDEIAVKWPDGYLYVQTSEDGYDYTIYDRFFREVDGGRLESTKSLKEVYTEILEDIKVNSEDVAYYNSGALLKEVEKVNGIDVGSKENLNQNRHMKP